MCNVHALFISSNTQFWTIQKPWRQFYLKIQNYGACVSMCAQFRGPTLAKLYLCKCALCMQCTLRWIFHTQPWIIIIKMLQLTNRPLYIYSELSTFWRRNETNTNNFGKIFIGIWSGWINEWLCVCVIQKWITRFTHRLENYFLRCDASVCVFVYVVELVLSNFEFSSV